MTTIEQQILETWFINHRTNLKLLDNLTEEALTLSTFKHGGGNVGYQLAHMPSDVACNMNVGMVLTLSIS